MNSFKGNISFFKGWLNFSSLKVLELLPAKARHNFFEILKLYIKLYIVQAEKQTMMPQAVSYLFDNNKNVKEDNGMDNIRIPIHIG